MKICYVATTTHISGDVSEGLGGTTHTIGVAKALRKHGHEVVVVSDRFEGDAGLETIDGVRVYRNLRGILLSSKKIKKSRANFALKKLNPLSVLALGLRVAQIVRRENCDVILERAQSRAAGAVASWITGKPLFLELIDNLSSRFSLSRAQRIFAYTYALLDEKFRNKVVLVDTGYDDDIFMPRKAEQEYDLCYAGSFKEWDGLEDLVDAVGILRNVRVLMIGDGTQYARIRGLVREKGLEGNFDFTGRVPLAEVPLQIARAKICLAPFNISRTDKGDFAKYGYYFNPLKLSEYIACGKPIIATDYEIIRRNFSDENGALFPEGDASALADAIRGLLAGKNLGKIAERNLEYSKKFSWFNVVRPMIAEMSAGARER